MSFEGRVSLLSMSAENRLQGSSSSSLDADGSMDPPAAAADPALTHTPSSRAQPSSAATTAPLPWASADDDSTRSDNSTRLAGGVEAPPPVNRRGGLLKVTTATLVMFEDRVLANFPYPFLADALRHRGYSNFEISFALSCDFGAAFIGYFFILLLQVYFDKPAAPDVLAAGSGPTSPHASNSDRSSAQSSSTAPSKQQFDQVKWLFLTIAGIFNVAGTVVQVFSDDYLLICLARVAYGLGSAVQWTYVLSLAGRMPRVRGIDATSYAVSGCNVGSVAGPFLGALCYRLTSQSETLAFLPLTVLPGLCTLLTTLVALIEQRASARSHAAFIASHQPDSSTLDAALLAPVDDSHTHSRSQSRQGRGTAAHVVRSASVNVQDDAPVKLSRMLTSPSQILNGPPVVVTIPEPAAPAVKKPGTGLCDLLGSRIFMQLSFLLFLTGGVRAQMEVMVPLYLSPRGISTDVVGYVFAITAVFYVLGSIAAGKYVTLTAKPMPLILWFIMLDAAILAAVLIMTDVYSLTGLLCAYGFIYIWGNVASLNQLQEYANTLGGGAATSDRVMGLSCLIWTGGGAVGVAVAGIPDDEDHQRLQIWGCSGGMILFALFLALTYGLKCGGGRRQGGARVVVMH